MTKSSALGLSALVAVVVAGFVLFSRPPAGPQDTAPASTDSPSGPAAAPDESLPVVTPPAPSPASEPATPPPAGQTPPVGAPKPKSPYARITIKAGDPIPVLTPFQDERDALMNLAASQDTKQIPVIARSLRHEDATVREAARQALLQLGSVDAVPILKDAAAASKNKEEADLLREAADFLALPRFPDLIFDPNPAPTPPFPVQ